MGVYLEDANGVVGQVATSNAIDTLIRVLGDKSPHIEKMWDDGVVADEAQLKQIIKDIDGDDYYQYFVDLLKGATAPVGFTNGEAVDEAEEEVEYNEDGVRVK